MSSVLLTGMSATGKSTVLAELARRGHRVVDTDEPGWIVLAADGEPLWDEARMAGLLVEDVPALFVAGCVANQGRFYDRFDAVVLLSVPTAVLLERLATRTTHAFGRDPATRERVLADLAEVEPLLRSGASVELDTDRPLQEVVDRVEALVTGRRTVS